ncbi:MAG: 3-methyl-2-oxobutanoate hydroxymethyltransferase [Planctomycetes bacterium]|nr:3-methyl-2-oxobutanoate hydroxymethyltransferase [Planctomycetota bacterium]
MLSDEILMHQSQAETSRNAATEQNRRTLASEIADSPQRAAPLTIRSLSKLMRSGQRVSCLTCYDATTARWLEQAGIEVLLVGDTAGEMVLGFSSTVHTPLDFLITLTAGVKRGAPNTLVMADMPFLSYQADDAEGVRNAGRFMTEGNADLVKVEVDRSFVPLVARMSRAGIPVVAHIGSRPQLSKQQGGYSAAGKSCIDAVALLDDARALVDAGAQMLLVEATPAEVAEQLVRESSVPVIGCGAGPACHGQVVVLQDLLGLTAWQPAFALPAIDFGPQLLAAARGWMQRVRTNDLGPHPYTMTDVQRDAFAAAVAMRRSDSTGSGGTT